jgi:hypothetical protein
MVFRMPLAGMEHERVYRISAVTIARESNEPKRAFNQLVAPHFLNMETHT